MIQNLSLVQFAKTIAWFVSLLAFSFLIFMTVFFLTVSFLGPLSRFVLIFLLTVGINFVLTKPFRFSNQTRYFLIVAPAVVCTLSYVLLGILQQSEFHCSEFTRCVYIMGSRICNPLLDWVIQLVCSFFK